MEPQVSPYTPSLYLPGSYGRYRQYPREVIARIPGTGYDARKLIWGEQVLNLDGSNRMSKGPQKYGWDGYDQVPLRGIGQTDPASVLALSSGWILAALAVGGLALVAMRSKGAPTASPRRRSGRRRPIYISVVTARRRRRAVKRRARRRS